MIEQKYVTYEVESNAHINVNHIIIYCTMMMDFFEPGDLLFIVVFVIIALFEYECWPMNILKDWIQRRLHSFRRNIIVLEIIQSAYEDYTPPKKSSCRGCGTEEPADENFQACSGCEAMIYCSRLCQKSDWKQHKAICLSLQRNDKRRLLMKKIQRKAEKFYALYSPLVNKLVIAMYLLYSRQLDPNNLHLPPEKYVLEITLSDLPDRNNAKTPRLYIKNLSVKEEKEQSDSQSDSSTREGIVKYRVIYSASGSGYIMRCGFTYDKEVVQMHRNSSDADLGEEVNGFLETINGIANGERPDLYEVIKECMKK